MRRQFLLGVVALALFACGTGGSTDAGPDAGPVTYERVQTIFNRSCVISSSCHNADGMRGDLDLTAANSFRELVNVDSTQAMGRKIVAPGDPANSYLLNKLEGTMNTIPICMMRAAEQLCGTRMPMVGGTVLGPDEMALIRDWISAGAPGPTGGSTGMDAGAGGG